MKSLSEILNKSSQEKKRVSETSEEWMIERGYIKTEAFGWELMEILEMFGLNPNAKGIPHVLIDEVEIKETKREIKDSFGNKTGQYEVKKQVMNTGKKIWSPSQNYLDYRKYKRDQYEQWYRQKHAISMNTPVIINEF